jgi:serine/threonine-protein kinase
MPTPAPEDFWKLLAASRLVADDAVGRLRRALAEEPVAQAAEAGAEANTVALAKWLVARGVITKWQARRLLNGESGPFFVGDYRLLERLESDGPGRVFRGRHEPSGRAVCLVLLDRRLCQRVDVWTEIVRRTTVANEATDPTLSRTWALEQVNGSRFIVCEDVPGESVADELARLGPLPPLEACRTLLPVFTAVAELHRRGAVHGSLSLDGLRREPAPPGTGERGGRVRLLQFPLAGDPHAVPGQAPVEATERIARLGRRASFVPPELLLPGRFCDERGDVYALGCMLHALLTGALPCWQGDAQRTLSHAAFVGPAPLGPPRVPVELATLVSYLVAREPDNRYADAAHAADALASSLGLPQVSAALPPPQRAAPPTAAAQAAVAAPAAAAPLVVATATPSLAQEAARRRAARLRLLGGGVAAGLVALALGVFFAQRSPSPSGDEAVAVPERNSQEEGVSPRTAPPQSATAAAKTDRSDRPDRPDKQGRGDAAAPEAEQSDRDAAPTVARRRAAEPQLAVVESQSLPWAGPTSGRPPVLEYLPPGAQIVLLTRPAEIVSEDEGKKFLKSLGPRVTAAVAAVEKACGCGLEGIESLQVGWQSGEGGAGMIAGWVASLREAAPLAADADAREQAWGPTEEEPFEAAGAGESLHVGPQLAYWLPAEHGGRVLVVAGRRLLDGMAQVRMPADAAEDQTLAASLPQDLATLVGMLDASRHLTVFGSPYALQTDARDALAGPLARLVDPLSEFVGDGVQAAALSLHFGPSLYAEVDVVAARAAPAPALARRLTDRIEGLADAVEEFCTALELHPYGKKLVMRLPAMMRVVAAQARAGAEGKGVVLNAYLPRHAGHNIVLASELALEQAASGGAGGGRVAATPAAAATPADPLQKKISLVFPKDTLEKSIQMLADEIGVPIEIQGTDLQLEGITKNQSFGLEERDQPAVAVLKTILAKADPAGRLVYVVRTKDGGMAIDVTTRAAAEKRGDKLPPGFEAAGRAEAN